MKTTAKHFADFKRYHAEYMRRYGLLQWRVEYEHKHLESSYATSDFNFTGKCMCVALATKWVMERPLNSRELRRLAKHEVNHALLHGLYWHARARFIQVDTLDEAEEGIVRVLDTLIPD